MARALHHAAGMSLPFIGGHAEADETLEAHVPEVVPIDELTADRIEAAEAEIEAEETGGVELSDAVRQWRRELSTPLGSTPSPAS